MLQPFSSTPGQRQSQSQLCQFCFEILREADWLSSWILGMPDWLFLDQSVAWGRSLPIGPVLLEPVPEEQSLVS